MAQIFFTTNLQRHVPCPPGEATGSCWVSDDQGDHWQCLGEHLPPIYCVRFA